MSFGTRLQVLRRASGLTQEEFAQQLNVSRQAVSKWESSKGYPEVEKLLYICSHFGVTMDELFLDEVPQAPPTPPDLPPSPPGERALDNPGLKAAFGNFFSNLSPRNQQMLSLLVSMILFLLVILFCLFCTTIAKGGTDAMIYKFTWLALLVVFTLVEGLTVGLTSIWFAAGALCALVCALVELNLWVQLAAFILVSALCLLAVRPVLQKHLNSNVEATNADRIIGSEAIVTEEINNLLALGAISIGGLTWSARSQHNQTIPAGTLVRVLRIEGVKVFVEEAKEATT